MMCFDDFQYDNINQFIFDVKQQEDQQPKKKKDNDADEESESTSSLISKNLKKKR